MEPTGKQAAIASNGVAILVDYFNISDCMYPRVAREFAPSIGLRVADVLAKLQILPENVEVVGHSIGAHIAGYIGSALNGKVKRITGKLQ